MSTAGAPRAPPIAQHDHTQRHQAQQPEHLHSRFRHRGYFALITVIGLNFGRLIGGTLIVEVIFGINGLGKYTVDGILGQDYIPVQGAILVIAVGYVLINFAVDMLYAALDPRIRHANALA